MVDESLTRMKTRDGQESLLTQEHPPDLDQKQRLDAQKAQLEFGIGSYHKFVAGEAERLTDDKPLNFKILGYFHVQSVFRASLWLRQPEFQHQ